MYRWYDAPPAAPGTEASRSTVAPLCSRQLAHWRRARATSTPTGQSGSSHFIATLKSASPWLHTDAALWGVRPGTGSPTMASASARSVALLASGPRLARSFVPLSRPGGQSGTRS